jgi:hypothetical protein
VRDAGQTDMRGLAGWLPLPQDHGSSWGAAV